MIIRSIDFETTGIPTPNDPQAIVEWGLSDLPADDYVCQIVNPGRKIPFEAMAVHHITDDMVLGRPTFSPSMLDGADIYIAHNADFERQFYTTSRPWICTWKVAIRVWPDLPQHNLQYLRYALALPVSMTLDMPHRAGPDAYLCALLFEAIQSAPNAPDIDAMIRWSDGPALYPRIPFGKHKGEKWSDVPKDYLDWIVNKSDLDRDAKANARHELKRRNGN